MFSLVSTYDSISFFEIMGISSNISQNRQLINQDYQDIKELNVGC